MHRTLAVILGGGAGTRLYPLTKYRAKPAVPLAGKYRLIDVAISNCINSSIKNIFVLTQYLSASLNRHVAQTYTFDMFTNGFVEILAAEQREDTGHWFQGTADALRQHWQTLGYQPDLDLVLVLPGDALYRMDLEPMIRNHRESGADISVAVNTVHRSRAHHFGLLALDEQGCICDFREKPKGEEMEGIEAPAEVLQQFGGRFPVGDTFLASMGVYVFNKDVMARYIHDTDYDDFGRQIIPAALKQQRCVGHIFPGYWEDIGTIDAFFEAHMGLLKDPPTFSFNVPDRPVFTHPRFLPNIYAVNANLERCRIAEGSILEGATIRNSVVGLRSIIRTGAVVEDSILMGNDFYEESGTRGNVPLGIGDRSVIRRAIIDKNARIGNGVKILNSENVQLKDATDYYIRDGIVIVPKGAVIEDGTVI